MRTSTRLAAVLSSILYAPLASAEPSLDLRNFHPPTDPRGSLFLEPTTTPGPAEWNVGAWFSYAHRQIVLDRPGQTSLVVLKHQLSLDYLASIGLGERLALGLALPTVLYQTGDDLGPGDENVSVPRTALGDVAITAKATLLPPGELGGFGLGAIGRVTVPTGNDSSLVSEDAVTGELRVLAELRLIALDVQTTLGARVRGQERTYLGRDFGHDLPWGAAISLRPQALGWDDAGHWTWTLETHGAVAITPEFASTKQSPALYGASARYALGDVSALLGVELPIGDAVGNPSVRVVAGFGWAPRFKDEDKDGVADDKDGCPELEEDREGYEDSDGCPEGGPPEKKDESAPEPEPEPAPSEPPAEEKPVDQDVDGVPDSEDACPDRPGPQREDPKLDGCPTPDTDGDTFDDPDDRCTNEREDWDGVADDDGCPEPAPAGAARRAAKPMVTVTRRERTWDVDLRAAPEFVVGPSSVELSARSLPPLRALASELNQHPTWVVLVGVKPRDASPEGEQEALSKSFAVVHALRTYTHRDDVAESVGFSAVKDQRGAAASGFGLLVLAPPEAATGPGR